MRQSFIPSTTERPLLSPLIPRCGMFRDSFAVGIAPESALNAERG